MKAEIYWVDAAAKGCLALMPHPRGGDWLGDDIRSLRDGGVDILVSLLTSDEVAELDLVQEQGECKKARIEFISFPIPDRKTPDTEGALPLIRSLAEHLKRGKWIAIHCRMGIGRSGTIAAGVLLQVGLPLEKVLSILTKARGVPVPETDEQQEWIERLSRRMKPR